MSFEGFVISAILIAIIWAIYFLVNARPGKTDLPPALNGAKLFACEKTFFRKAPVHAAAKPDEIWQLNGKLYIVETKTRKYPNIFDTDRLQIEASAYTVRDRHQVSDIAWVRIIHERGVSFKQVNLHGDDYIVDMHREIHRIKNGAHATPTTKRAVCQGCAHARCDDRVA